MNTTAVEVSLGGANKEIFLNWMEENEGPHFYEQESQKYFYGTKEYEEYYAEKYENEVCLFTVVPVYCEVAVRDLICEVSENLDIPLKFICMYQDPGTGETSDFWGIVDGNSYDPEDDPQRPCEIWEMPCNECECAWCECNPKNKEEK